MGGYDVTAPRSSESHRPLDRPWLLLAGAVLLVGWHAAVPLWKLASTGAAGTWHDVFQDSGVTYFVADRLNAGEQLYTDVAYPYGPIPVWVWAGFAELGGNVPRSYAVFSLAGNLLFVFLLYLAIKRATGRFAALAVCVFGLALWGNTPYHPFERCLFATLLLTWEPPAERSLQRALLAGCLLGCWQWVKFGGVVYAAAALVVVDVAVLLAGRADRRAVRHWLATTLAAVASASLVEIGRIAWAYATLPPETAGDFVWPSYTMRLYQTYQHRYPGWHGWRYFVLRDLIPASGLAATAVAGVLLVVRLWRSSGVSRRAAALLVPPLFFLLGVGTYLGHVYVYMMYTWCLMPPAAVLIHRWPRVATTVFVLLWLPGITFQMRESLHLPASDLLETLPRDHPVAWEPEYRAAYRAVAAEWDRWSGDPEARPIVMPVGSGFYFLHGCPAPLRHTWLLPHYFRPFDRQPFLDGLDRAPFLVYTGVGAIPDEADLSRLIEPTLGPTLTAAIQSRVQEEVRVNAVCRIYRLRRIAGPAD